MKKSISVLFILILGLILFNISYAKAEVKKDAGYISLSGSKTIEAAPNKAQISFAVETDAADAQSAVKENNEISNKIITALKIVTKPQVDTIKTNNFSVRPNYVYGKDGVRRIKRLIPLP